MKFNESETYQTIPERFASIAQQFPNRLAIDDSQYSLTYQELDYLSAQYADFISSAFPSAEQYPVPILFSDSAEIYPVILGIIRAGHFYCAIPASNHPSLIAATLKDLNSPLLFCSIDSISTAKECAASNCRIVEINSKDIYQANKASARNSISAKSFAGVYYTSGSTGSPKGVLRSHQMLLRQAWNLHTQVNFDDTDRLLGHRPLSNASSSTEVIGSILNGAAIFPYDLKKNGVDHLANFLMEKKITIFRPTVPVLRYLLDGLKPASFFADLRCIMATGDVFYRRDVERLRTFIPDDAIIVHQLASTEVGTLCYNKITSKTILDSEIIPVGYAAPGKEILILDENGVRAKDGQAGEIAIRSDFTFAGYWKQPELSSESFIIDRDYPGKKIFHSGDIGRLRQDGQLEFLGRKDLRVKIRGFSVDMSAIESVLMAMPGISSAIVKAVSDNSLQRRLVAYFVPLAGIDISVNHLKNFLAGKLPDYMLPATFIMMPNMPLNPAGKIKRDALPEPDWAQITSQKTYADPENELHEQLISIWKAALKLEKIGIDDDFFDLGGDSLIASLLFTLLERKTGIRSSPTTLVQHGTVRKFAEMLNENRSNQNIGIVPIQPHGKYPAVFWIPSGYGVDLYTQGLRKYFLPDHPLYMLEALGAGENIFYSKEEISLEYAKRIKHFLKQEKYYLVGHSAGGLIACEVGRALTQMGLQVGWVGMLDSFPPYSQPLGFIESLHLFLKNISTLGLIRAGLDAQRNLFVALLKFLFSFNFLRAWIVRRKKFPLASLFSIKQFSYVKSTFTSYIYAPQRFPFKIVLFRASGTQRYRLKDLSSNWKNYAEQLNIIDVPGDHVSMMEGENLEHIARTIQEQFQQ